MWVLNFVAVKGKHRICRFQAMMPEMYDLVSELWRQVGVINFVQNFLLLYWHGSCECCVLSDISLCDGPITRPGESYRVWCFWVWSWSLDNVEALAHWGLLRHGNIILACQLLLLLLLLLLLSLFTLNVATVLR